MRTIGHLDELEHEAIYIIREAAAQFGRAALLFSGGKDSAVLATLARKAFRPARCPFPLLHVDTGFNFPEVLAFRDRFAAEGGFTLHVRKVQDSLDQGRIPGASPTDTHRNAYQSVTLLDAIRELGLDACLGGARRDEEKARAKERIFSHRDAAGQWSPKTQRAEPWILLNGRKRPGEHFRVFPLSNWTELDVWRYIERERIALPSLYFAHERALRAVGDMWLAPLPGEEAAATLRARVRFRTVGDVTCSGAIRSDAATPADVIAETLHAALSERGTRQDDTVSDSAMEDRKREGYF